MRRKARHVIWILTALFTLGAGPQQETAEQVDGLDLFFRDADLLELSEQDLAVYPDIEAGEATSIPRDFPDAPPQIPHSVSDMLPILADDNECLECHHPENVVEKTDVAFPDSHFDSALMGPGAAGYPMVWVVKGYEKRDDLAGARYNCTMCHTPQATNVKNVENRFQSARKQ